MSKKAKMRTMVLDSAVACNDSIAEVGRLRRELLRLETSMNDLLAVAKTEYELAAQHLRVDQRAHEAAIEAYASEHRDELTGGGKTQSHRFGNGEVKWRSLPAKVNIRNVEKALAWVLEAGAKFRRFLRVSHELDKGAMLKEPELAAEIPGIRIASDGEKFEIEPFEGELEEPA